MSGPRFAVWSGSPRSAATIGRTAFATLRRLRVGDITGHILGYSGFFYWSPVQGVAAATSEAEVSGLISATVTISQDGLLVSKTVELWPG